MVALRDGLFEQAEVAPTFSGVLRLAADASVVGLDLPIGLVEQGWRQADLAAREFLGRRRPSVFPIPPRSVLAAPTYQEANARVRTLVRKGISEHSYGPGARIAEVEEQTTERVSEVHSEVSFQVLAGRPLAYSKKT